MKRIFIAINLPGQIKNQLAELQENIKTLFPAETRQAAFKWVEPENLHITLAFLGAVKEEKLPGIISQVKGIAQTFRPFKVFFKRVCYDSLKGIPRLIWVGLEKNDLLDKMVNGFGNPDFSGHITLARVKGWVWKGIEPEERPDIERELTLKIDVHSIELMESRLARSGPEYIILQSFPLLGID